MDEHELIDNGWTEPEDDYDLHDPCNPRNMTKDERAAYDKACWSGYVQYETEDFFYGPRGRQILEHAMIAKAWALPRLTNDENPIITSEKYTELAEHYADRIYQAVFSGKINGIMAWKSWAGDKWVNAKAETSRDSIDRVLLDKKISQTHQDYFDICLEIHIDRNDFSVWLSKEPDAESAVGCVLNLWLENKYLEPKDHAKISAETKGRNQQRSKIANEWYASIRSKFDNNSGSM